MVGAAALVAANDPAAPGSRFPSCTFRQLTGLWCPGCGLTRGTHHLLNGDLGAAVASNVFTPLVALALAGAWWAWWRHAGGHRTGGVLDRAPRWASPVLLGAVVVFGVVRNLPIAPFDALAP